MFGFSFKDRVKKVLREEFGYEPAGGIAHVLNEISDQAKNSGANEYSAAIMTMFVAMNSLTPDPSDARVTDFIKEHSLNVARTMHQANQPENDIKEMLEEILENHGLLDGVRAAVNEDQVDDTDELLNKLNVAGNSFIDGLLRITDMLASSDAREIVSEDQLKFIYFLQLWGAMDLIMQNEGSSDVSRFMATMSVLPTVDLFDWPPEKTAKALELAEEAQDTDWGIAVIMNGGKAFGKFLSEDEDKMFTAEVLQDRALLEQIAQAIPESF